MSVFCAIDLKMFCVTIDLSYSVDPRDLFASAVQSEEP